MLTSYATSCQAEKRVINYFIHTLSSRLPVARMTWVSVTLMGSSFAEFSIRLPTPETLRMGRPVCQAQNIQLPDP